jgi:signal transduction histidine kinase
MSKIVIGKADGKNAAFDLDVLLPSRLLITADSGGGKSWLMRALQEQLFGKVQIITIDPEGEFASLRENFPFVLVGKGGETPADTRSAGLVAERLLKLRASAICDIFELKPHERHTWVKLFLVGLIEAPKELRNPCIVIVDEAHMFCPERGMGESEASGAMIDLCTRGRKRGLCAVWATQRLASVDKNASSMLQNRMVGPTFEDVNRKRAGEMLGVLPGAPMREFFKQIQLLEPGYFFALGRAIAKERLLVHVRAIETTHPKAFGAKHTAPPPPTPDKIKAMLPKLADLPKEAEEKARTEADFRREIRELKTKLSAADRASAQSALSKPDPEQAKQLVHTIHRNGELTAALENAMRVIAKITAFGFEQSKVNPKQLEIAVQKAVEEVGQRIAAASAIRHKEFEQLKREADVLLKRLEKVIDKKIDISVDVVRAEPPFVLGPSTAARRAPLRMPAAREPRAIDVPAGEFRPSATHLKMAAVLAAYYPDPIDKALLASMCGKTLGGGWNGRLSELNQAGLLEYVDRGSIRATERCAREYAGRWTPPTNTEEAIAVWNFKLSDTHRAMLNRLIEADGEPVSKAELAAAAGKSLGGGFNGRLSELRSTGLMVDAGRGFFRANKQALFLNGDAA